MPRQTDARNAVWTAIENWSGLQDGGTTVFRRLYKFDDDEAPEINPKEHELPAIAIFPGDSIVETPLNKSHQHEFPLDILIFTKTWNLETAENYVEQIIKAVWQSTASGQTVPEVKRVTGFWPMSDRPPVISYERIKLENTKAIIAVLTMTLRLRFDPTSA